MTANSRLNHSSRSIYKRDASNFLDVVPKDYVTVVIPTLNEELAIGRVIEDIYNEGYYHIMIVDGYSSDDTLSVAKQYNVTVLRQHGKGKTGAIKTAIEHVGTPYIVIIDGDYTYSAKDIERFLPHLKYNSEIIGARKLGRKNIRMLNRFGNWVINKTFNLLFGTNLNDVCSGLYALETSFAKSLSLETQGFDVEVEIAAQAVHYGSICEVPISYGKRIGIQKLNPLRDGYIIQKTILRMARKYNPLPFFSFLSTLAIIPSSILLAWVALEWLNGIWHSGLALFGVFLVILSVQAFTFGAAMSNQRSMERRILHKINGK